MGCTEALRNQSGQFYRERYSLKVIDVPTGKIFWTAERGHPFGYLQFLANGRELVGGESDRVVHLWDRNTGQHLSTFIGHNSPIRAVAYSSKVGLLASADFDGTIRLWDVSDGADRRRVQGFLGSFQFPSMQTLVVDPTTEDILTRNHGQGVIRWQKNSGYRAVALMSADQMDWTADGRMLTISTEKNPNDPGVTPGYSLQLGGPAAEGNSTKFTIESPVSPSPPIVRIFPDGKSLITTGKVATVWNLKTGEPWRWGLLMGHTAPVVDLDISADGQRIVTLANGFGVPKAEVRAWEVPSDPDAIVRQLQNVVRAQMRQAASIAFQRASICPAMESCS